MKKTLQKLKQLSTENPLKIAIAIFILVFSAMVLTYIASKKVDRSALGSPENFGQFGDYIGGLLNPIFGLFTVLLLLCSIRVQLRELRLARIEFKRSSKALEDQAKISRDENARIQLAEMLEIEHSKIETIWNSEHNKIHQMTLSSTSPPSGTSVKSLNQLYLLIINHSGRPATQLEIQKNISDVMESFKPTQNLENTIFMKIVKAKEHLEHVKTLTLDIIYNIHISSIRQKWIDRLKAKAEMLFDIGAMNLYEKSDLMTAIENELKTIEKKS